MVSYGLQHTRREQIQQVDDEVVGVLGHEVVGFERLRREVLEVEGHDQARARVNRGGHHMTVVRVGQLDRRDQVLKPGDQAVADMAVHQLACSVQLLGCEIGPTGQHVARPLVVDRVTPARPVQIRQRQMHQQIAQRCRVEHAGVIDDGEVRTHPVSTPCRVPGPGPPTHPAPCGVPHRCGSCRRSHPGNARGDGCRSCGTGCHLSPATGQGKAGRR